MPWYSEIYALLAQHFFGWRDVVEIALFSILIYSFSLWLKRDKQKHLLLYFYGYCCIVLGAYWAQLPTVSFLLFITSPIAIMLFIMMHQETLQKNFVMLRNIMPATAGKTDWLETLIRTALVAANNNKSVHCVIEHTDSLSSYLTTPLPLHTQIQKNILAMILESETFETDKLLWLNSKGLLLGMNAHWSTQLEDAWLDNGAKKLAAWEQDALFFTAQSDAIVFNINPQTRLFSIFAQGKIFNNINAPLALKTIEKYISVSSKDKKQKEMKHEAQFKNNSTGQHTT